MAGQPAVRIEIAFVGTAGQMRPRPAFWPRDNVRIVLRFFDAAAAKPTPVDGRGVRLVVQAPGAAAIEYTEAELTQDAVGVWHLDTSPDSSGAWRVEGSCTEPVEAAAQARFDVRRELVDGQQRPDAVVQAAETGEPLVTPGGSMLTVQRVDRAAPAAALTGQENLGITQGDAFRALPVQQLFDDTAAAVLPNVTEAARTALRPGVLQEAGAAGQAAGGAAAKPFADQAAASEVIALGAADIARDHRIAAQGAAGTATTKAGEATSAATLATGAATNVDSRLSKAGGTMTGALTLLAPTAAAHAARRADVDAVPTYPTLIARLAAGIPTGVTLFRTLAYASVTDYGAGTWRVGVPPVGNRPGWREATGGVWVEYVDPAIVPDALGARPTTSGSTVDGPAIAEAAALLQARASAVPTEQYPAVRQPFVQFLSGRYNGGGQIIATPYVGATFIGMGRYATRLDALQFSVQGRGWELGGFSITSQAGRIPGSFGVQSGDPLSRGGTLRDVIIRDQDVGLDWWRGATHRLPNVSVERCNVGVDWRGAGDTDTSTLSINNCLIGELRRGSGEIKHAVARIQNHAVIGTLVRGDRNQTAVECYDYGTTRTVGQRTRILPVVRVEDNGSGQARFITSEAMTLTGCAPVTENRFSGGMPGVQPQVWFGLTGTLGLDSVMAGTTELLDAVIPAGAPATVMAAGVASINRGFATHGHYAEQNGAEMTVYAPRAQGASGNGTLLSVTASGVGTVTQAVWTEFTTAAPHGLAPGGDVEIIGTSSYNGIEEVAWCPTTTRVVVPLPYVTSQAGTAYVPNLLASGEDDLLVSGLLVAAYNGSWRVVRCDTHWVELGPMSSRAGAIAYVGAVDPSGTIGCISPDIVLDAREGAIRANDTYRYGGNHNRERWKGAYNIQSIGVRQKSGLVIDRRAVATSRTQRVMEVRSLRARIGDGFQDMYPAGAAEGWGGFYCGDDTGALTPAGNWWGLSTAHTAAGLVDNRAAALNRVAVMGTGIRLTLAGVDYLWTPLVADLLTHRLSAPVGAVNGLELLGAVAGGRPTLRTRGEATAGLTLTSGTAPIELRPGNLRALDVRYLAAAVNYAFVTPAIAGGKVTIGTAGEAAVPLLLAPGGGANVEIGGPAQLRSYTKATVPDVAIAQRALISVSDATGGPAPCFSTGGAWINLRTNAVLS